jgi:hypothetical protein
LNVLEIRKGRCVNRQFCTASEEADAAKIILVDIPVDSYNGFLEKCETWRGEFDILETAVISHDLDRQGYVEIPCEVMHAELLRDLALTMYPLAVAYIEDSIKVARQP